MSEVRTPGAEDGRSDRAGRRALRRAQMRYLALLSWDPHCPQWHPYSRRVGLIAVLTQILSL